MKTLFKPQWVHTAVFALSVSLESAAQCFGPDSFSVSLPRCINTSITFTDLSATLPVQSVWKFGDGAELTLPGNSTTATHSYSAPGTYTVVLVGHYSGCTDSVVSLVTVDPFPVASFSFTQTGSCGGLPIVFTSSSTGAGSYLWHFGDPSSGVADTSTLAQPQHAFISPGTGQQSYTVTLTAISANGCSAQTSQTLSVPQVPDASIADASGNGFSGCDVNNLALTVTNASTTLADNVHYHINWGNGSPDYDGPTFTSASTVYNSQGMFPITVTVTGSNGCTGTKVYNAFNGSNPSIGLSTPGSTIGLCGPITIQFPLSNFGNNPPGTIYTVLTNDGSPTTVYNHPPPSLITHSFNGSSCGHTGLGGSANSFYLRVIASNPCGESMVTVEPIRVSEEPSVGFSGPQTACVNVSCHFGAQLLGGTTVSNQGVCNSTLTQLSFRYWSIDPPTGWTTSSNLQNSTSANIIFLVPDTYTVTFVGGTACGRDTMRKTVCVTGIPAPDFSLSTDKACTPFTAGTQNLSPAAVCTGSIPLWSVTPIQAVCQPIFPQWQFDSATTAQSAEPVFAFYSPGKYRVALTLSNTCGTRTHADTVTIKSAPRLTLSPLPSACGTQSITPELAANACLGESGLTYAWSFPGATPSSSTNLHPGTVLYNSPGNYSVTISAGNECGSTDTTAAFSVFPIPPANAGADVAVCPGDTAYIGSPASGLSYTWSPSPSLTAPDAAQTGVIGVNPSGNILVRHYILSVADSHCTGMDTVAVTIYPAPAPPSVQSDTVCAGQPAQVYAGGTGSIIWYDVPTGGTPTDTGNTHTTPALFTDQTYYAEHTDANCTSLSRTAVTVTVHPLPATDAGPDITVCDQPVGIQLPTSPSGGIWTGSQVTASGIFTPAGTGIFQNIYGVTDANGCSRADTMLVTVISPTQAVTQADTTVCAGAPSFALTALPAGGVWSGGSVSPSGLFTPSVAGNYPLLYTFGSGSCAVQDTLSVTVIEQPVVEAGNAVGICAGSPPFTLTGNTPVGGIWSGPGISNDTLGTFDPSTVAAGQYTAVYTVQGANGCPASDTRTVTVYALPTVNAGPDVQLCNQPIPVSFTASPVGGFWTDGNMTPGGVYTPSATGIFHPVYTYVDANGCGRTDTLSVTVVEPPAINAPDIATVCRGSSPFLLSASPANGSWTGSGINTGGWFTPTVAGTFHPIYTVGSGTCQVWDTVTVVVHPLPVVAAGNDTTLCSSAAPFVLQGASPAGGSWAGMGITDVVTGIFSPSAAGAGTWPATYLYTDSNACHQSDQRLIHVLALPSAGFQADSLACTGTGVPFTATVSGANTYAWTFGDGTTSALPNPLHVYTGEGYFTVQLIVSAGPGCSDTAGGTVHVIGIPQAGILATPASGCGPLMVDLSSSTGGTGTVYLWDLGNGSSSALPAPGNVLYPAPQTSDTAYMVTLTVSNACGTDQASQTVTVFAQPTAIPGANVNTGCSPLGVQFVQLSTGGVTGVFWDFGDGSTSLSPNPGIHTFVTGGNDTIYTVMLAIQTTCGPDTAYIDIHVHPNTVQAFFNTNHTEGCPPLEVDFTNFSSGGTVNEWFFGDGNVSNGISPTHTYLTSGNYIATLAVNNGCSYDTAQVAITVFDFPSVNFTVPLTALCEHQPVTFSNTSVDISNSLWDFGDGDTSNTYSPTHAYDVPGTFLVSLTGTSLSDGCPATVSATVTVKPTPTLHIEFPPGAFCAPFTASFTNTSTQTDYYDWDFGDGNTAAGPNPTHTFMNGGTYTVTVIGEHAGGCKDTALGTVQVLPSPEAAFVLPPAACLPAQLSVTNQTTGAISYSWDFGNGNTSTLNQPSILYNTPGHFTVTLQASNEYGCTDTVTRQIVIFHPPSAIPGDPMQVCAGTPVPFANFSLHADGYEWHFSNGSVSTLEQPQYTFNIPGTYDVTLIASNDGCSDTIHLPGFVTVFPIPVAFFVIQPDTVTSTHPLINLLSDQPPPNTCLYYLPNGSTIDKCKTEAILSGLTPGTHIIMLTVTNEFGCRDSSWHYVFMMEGATLYVPNSFTPNADGENDVFYAVGTGIKTFEMTIFDRWGNQIFKTQDILQGWDGKNVVGQTVKQDVYVWKIIARDLLDEPIHTDGRVTVIY